MGCPSLPRAPICGRPSSPRGSRSWSGIAHQQRAGAARPGRWLARSAGCCAQRSRAGWWPRDPGWRSRGRPIRLVPLGATVLVVLVTALAARWIVADRDPRGARSRYAATVAGTCGAVAAVLSAVTNAGDVHTSVVRAAFGAFAVGGIGSAVGAATQAPPHRDALVHRPSRRPSRRPRGMVGCRDAAGVGRGTRRRAAHRSTSTGRPTCGPCSTRASAARWPWRPPACCRCRPSCCGRRRCCSARDSCSAPTRPSTSPVPISAPCPGSRPSRRCPPGRVRRLGVPARAGAAAGRRRGRLPDRAAASTDDPDSALLHRLAHGAAAGAVAGFVVGLAVAVSGGGIGPGRMADAGPPLLTPVLVAVPCWPMGGALGAVLAHYRGARAPQQRNSRRTARLVVLVSGGGTNLQALIDATTRTPDYGAEIVAVGADRDGIEGLARAERAGIPPSSSSPPTSTTGSTGTWSSPRRSPPTSPTSSFSPGSCGSSDRPSWDCSAAAPSTPIRRCCRRSPACTRRATPWSTASRSPAPRCSSSTTASTPGRSSPRSPCPCSRTTTSRRCTNASR